jgi:hypothetical protein
MARTPKNTDPGKKKQSKGGRKSIRNPAAALEHLQINSKAARSQYGNAEKTTKAYAGYFVRGSEFLAEIVGERRKKEAEDAEWVCPQGIATDLLEKAFDNPPNKYSAVALELFITQKCIVENLGKSTAQGIHGAFAKHWDNM